MKAYVVAMLAAAGTASAQIDRSDYSIYTPSSAVSVGGGVDASIASIAGPVYSNVSDVDEGFFGASSPAPDGDGNLEAFASDDYTSILTAPEFLDEFVFVGGVDAVDGVVFFDFFDAGGNLVDGFGVALGNAGNFIYTIDITNNDVLVPEAGFVQAVVDDDGSFTGVPTTFTWFLTADDATIGDNGAAAIPAGSPAGADLNFTFELVTIPSPASAALLGLGGLVAARRRR